MMLSESCTITAVINYRCYRVLLHTAGGDGGGVDKDAIIGGAGYTFGLQIAVFLSAAEVSRPSVVEVVVGLGSLDPFGQFLALRLDRALHERKSASFSRCGGRRRLRVIRSKRIACGSSARSACSWQGGG